MSSQTSASRGSSDAHRCVVCGKETTMGCGVCQRAGLTWMCFCSKEHQRLIWKTHKRVCGKNPFVWPPLSDKEAKEYFELRNEIWMAGKSQSFMEKIVDVDGEHKPESNGRTLNVLGTFKNVLDMAQQDPVSAQQEGVTKEEYDSVLASLRTFAYFVRETKIPSPAVGSRELIDTRIRPLIIKHPFEIMAYSLAKETGGDRSPTDHPCRKSNYLHRFLILTATVGAQLKALEDDPGSDTPESAIDLTHVVDVCTKVDPACDPVKYKDGCLDDLAFSLVSMVDIGLAIEIHENLRK